MTLGRGKVDHPVIASNDQQAIGGSRSAKARKDTVDGAQFVAPLLRKRPR